jgi:hypothetical protein
MNKTFANRLAEPASSSRLIDRSRNAQDEIEIKPITGKSADFKNFVPQTYLMPTHLKTFKENLAGDQKFKAIEDFNGNCHSQSNYIEQRKRAISQNRIRNAVGVSAGAMCMSQEFKERGDKSSPKGKNLQERLLYISKDLNNFVKSPNRFKTSTAKIDSSVRGHIAKEPYAAGNNLPRY